MNRNAKVTTSADADALYIAVSGAVERGSVAYSESLALSSRQSEVVFDFSEDGVLLGIEIIGIAGLLPQE